MFDFKRSSKLQNALPYTSASSTSGASSFSSARKHSLSCFVLSKRRERARCTLRHSSRCAWHAVGGIRARGLYLEPRRSPCSQPGSYHLRSNQARHHRCSGGPENGTTGRGHPRYERGASAGKDREFPESSHPSAEEFYAGRDTPPQRLRTWRQLCSTLSSSRSE